MDSTIAALLARYLDAWNARDADAMAETLCEDAVLVGFDGSVMKGREDARTTLRQIFADHPTGRYVWLLRGTPELAPGVVALYALAGLVPAGKDDIDPSLTAVLSLVALRQGGEWRIRMFQTTPAQLHGQPQVREDYAAELRAELGRRLEGTPAGPKKSLAGG